MRATKFVESYFDAWNHYDPEGVAGHLAADGIYCDVPENMQRSREELVTSLRSFFSRYRHRYELTSDVLTSGNTVAFEYRMVPPGDDQSQDVYRGAEFIALHDDTAMTIMDYYDVPGVSRSSTPALLTSREMHQRKYAKSGLDDERLLEYRRRVEKIMETEQLFLRSDITLPKLADAVGCSVNHLSQVINSGFGMSFFDYLSRHRIDHAKKLLANLDGQNRAILNIAFTVGFNSNSAFYAAFKKFVGRTPAQYRRAQTTAPH